MCTRSAWEPLIGNRWAAQDIVCAIRNDGISDNHSIAYCLLGYLCAYFRHYHPLEFLTAFLNDAANDDDIQNGTAYANQIGIQITAPRFGASKDIYYFNTEHRTIAKGLASVKYMSASVANDLFEISKLDLGGSFVDLWRYIKDHTAIDSRQMDSLIKIDYFSDFGNNAELLRIVNIIDFFNGGKAKSIKKDKLDPTMEAFVAAHGTDKGVKGNELKSYTITDMDGLLHDLEDYIKSLHLPELPYRTKAQNQKEILGYVDLITHLEQDRRKLYILDVRPLKSKFTGKTWSYLANTKSIGSGRTSRLFIRPWIFEKAQFAEGDLIYASHLQKEINKAGAEYWWLYNYDIVPG